jgi:hypothetical protein
MRFEYRIKVVETYGGVKKYIPQVGTPKLTICKRSVYPWLEWKNLWKHPTYINWGISCSNEHFNEYDTEFDAREIINKHQEIISEENNKKVKKVNYIKIG